MVNYRKSNLANWNDRTSIHEKSAFYDLDSFKSGKQSLCNIELTELPEVAGKSLLHLQCHFGMDTLSWARLGAKVTGVDFSDKAIALAKKLSDELKISAQFVQSDIYELTNVLDDKFDIVFTSYGVLCWLDDLQGWANTIHHFLKPNGTFLIVEEHPLSSLFDDSCEPSLLKIGYPYFNKTPFRFIEEHSYTDSTEKIENTENYQWIHTLDEIISSLLTAGLQIQSFREYPFLPYRRFSWMVQDADDWWVLPPECKHSVPLLFSLKAKRD